MARHELTREVEGAVFDYQRAGLLAPANGHGDILASFSVVAAVRPAHPGSGSTASNFQDPTVSDAEKARR